MLVFLVMGAGLATPYVLLACVPGLARLAPRPGRWMELLKQGLAFPMYGAAAWLLWVVSQEAGSAGVLATAAGFVLLGFAGWAIGVSQAGSRSNRRLGQSVATAALLAALAVLGGIATSPRAPAAEAANGAEAFSTARLAALRAEGRPVFVNMTAAWCVTCLVNERVAIGTAAVQDAFASRHVAYLKGDWTRQDSAITAYLREHGRDGVPLYLYYPPGGGPPATLPQILTENIVLAALDRG
jgi:thiol:disulfide interchange protein DsbD